MTDHNKRITAKKQSLAGRFSTFCDAVCKLPPIAILKRYRGYRRAGFAFRPSFWMSANQI